MLRIKTSLKFGEDGLQGLSQNLCANGTATCPRDPEVRAIMQKLRARKEMAEAEEKRLDEWKEALERALEKAEEAGKADTATPPPKVGARPG
jgi:DNA integrity scanning protein DisA with diadenylate cyclase activity